MYELYHSGILGMHWGIRRYQNKDGSLTPAGRERYYKLSKQLEKTKNVKKAEKIQAELDKLSNTKVKEAEQEVKKKFNVKDLSDTDLANMLNRMQMEKRYYELEADLAEKTKTPEQRKKELKQYNKEKFKQNLIDTMQRTGLEVLSGATKTLANNALKSLFEDANDAVNKGKDGKSNTDKIREEQLKQQKLITEHNKRVAKAEKQAAKDAKKAAKQAKKDQKLNAYNEQREKSRQQAMERAALEDEMRYNQRKSAYERQQRLQEARQRGQEEAASSRSSFEDVAKTSASEANNFARSESSKKAKNVTKSILKDSGELKLTEIKNYTNMFTEQKNWSNFLTEIDMKPQNSDWNDFLRER